MSDADRGSKGSPAQSDRSLPGLFDSILEKERRNRERSRADIRARLDEPPPLQEPPAWLDDAPLPGGTQARKRGAAKVWALGELLAADFPPPVWVVDGLLPAGLSLLAGRPKLGKSFMGLQLALAVGAGGRFLGRDVAQGRALYVALEDSPRRLQTRLKDMGAAALDGLSLAFGWPALNTPDGIDALADAIRANGLKLVVIDTLARAIEGRMDWDEIGQVTALMGGLQELALAADACILLIDHHRKGNGMGADVVDDVMGSTGKSAVCDTIWGLYRKRGDKGATLALTGRDVEEAQLGVAFDPATSCWQVAEDTQGVRVGTMQAAIVGTLKGLGGEATTAEIADILLADRSQVSREMGELVAKGVVVKGKKRGREQPYLLVEMSVNHATDATHAPVDEMCGMCCTIDTHLTEDEDGGAYATERDADLQTMMDEWGDELDAFGGLAGKP
jgi:hypothetical protein